MGDDKEAVIKDQVTDILTLERQLEATELELMKLEKFKAFIQLQKTVREKSAEVWKRIEADMIENDIKSIKGDWGSLTIAERTDFDIDYEQLQPKFYKKVPDTTKISATYKLENKPPKGTTPKIKKYLTKRFK